MAVSVQRFIDRLAEGHRVAVLGGLAVIAHGLSRHTQDADVWLEPMDSATTWAGVLEDLCREFPGTSLHRLPGWVGVTGQALVNAVEETGMVRVKGLSQPLDVFRRPNEFEAVEFEEMAARAHRNADGTLLPHPTDLIQTKIDTGRDKDRIDIFHLECVIRAEYRARLPLTTAAEARDMLERYSDWEVLTVALEHPAAEVRELALTHLREFAAEGDPFSQAVLAGRPLPGA